MTLGKGQEPIFVFDSREEFLPVAVESTGEGKSPESPGCQGDRWNAPHRYHSSARHQR